MKDEYQGINVLVKGNKGQQLLSLPMDNEELLQACDAVGAASDNVTCISDIDVDVIKQRWLRDYDAEQLNDIAAALEGIDGNDELRHLAAYVDATGYDLYWAVSHFDDSIYYGNESLEDIAYDIINDCYNLPDIAKNYIDYAAFGRDMVLNGELVDTDYGYISVY